MNERLKALSPLDKLELGYAFVTDKKFKRINSVKKLKKDDIITLRFRDGSADAKIISGDDISSLWYGDKKKCKETLIITV